jgi:hypothetical protein
MEARSQARAALASRNGVRAWEVPSASIAPVPRRLVMAASPPSRRPRRDPYADRGDQVLVRTPKASASRSDQPVCSTAADIPPDSGFPSRFHCQCGHLRVRSTSAAPSRRSPARASPQGSVRSALTPRQHPSSRERAKVAMLDRPTGFATPTCDNGRIPPLPQRREHDGAQRERRIVT